MADDPYFVPARSRDLDPPPALPEPSLACVANLRVDDGDVSGLNGDSGISFAFMADTDVIWAFFAASVPEGYGWNVTSTSGSATATNRQTDYIEITVADATEPYDLSIQIYTVS